MTLSITVLSAIMLSVWLLKSYAECPFAECRYAECRSTKFYNIGTLMGTMNGGTTTSGTSFLTTTLFFRLSWISLLWRSWSQRLYVFYSLRRRNKLERLWLASFPACPYFRGWALLCSQISN